MNDDVVIAAATTAAVTWPMVALYLIAAVPGIIAAILAGMAAMKSNQNAAAVEKVHVLVNSQMSAMRDKLEAALQQVGELSGRPKKSELEAPTKAQADYKTAQDRNLLP